MKAAIISQNTTSLLQRFIDPAEIANLALYFALNTLFTATSIWTWGPLRITIPDAASVNPVAAGITLVALVLTFVLRWPILRVLGVCALLGPASLLIPL